jgi:hypothetical protein
MYGMIANCPSLALISLGAKVSFKENPGLPDGTWTGPGGSFTTQELVSSYNGSTMAGTYVRAKATDISTASVTFPACRYTGKALTPAPTVKLGGTVLRLGTDYDVSYSNNVNAGTATATIRGKGLYVGEARKAFSILGVKLDGNAKVSLKASKPYAGGKVYQSASELKVTATVGGKAVTLVRGRDYSVAHSNNGKPGTATVTVVGKGNYWGKATAAFTITKGANKLSASRVAAKYQASASKATVVFGSKVFKVSNPAKGAISYSKKSGPAKVSIDARTGKVTVAKGLRPGTYRATFTVRSAATEYYGAASKDVSVAFVVK